MKRSELKRKTKENGLHLSVPYLSSLIYVSIDIYWVLSSFLFPRSVMALRKAEKEEERRAREKIRQKLEEDKVGMMLCHFVCSLFNLLFHVYLYRKIANISFFWWAHTPLGLLVLARVFYIILFWVSYNIYNTGILSVLIALLQSPTQQCSYGPTSIDYFVIFCKLKSDL